MVNGFMEHKPELRAVLEQISGLLLELDGEGRILYASPGWDRVLGFQPTQLLQLIRMFHAEDRVRVEELIGDCCERGVAGRTEYRLRGKEGGDWLWLELQAVPFGGEAGAGRARHLLHRDMTDRRRYEERLLTLAYHDPLTGLPNRRLFREHLNQALAMSKRSGQMFGILYFDVNDFKRINDAMGHDIGDRFLQQFAARIRGSCGKWIRSRAWRREIDRLSPVTWSVRLDASQTTVVRRWTDPAERRHGSERRLGPGKASGSAGNFNGPVTMTFRALGAPKWSE
ncbi:hypothetical protein SD70_24330 [Gordoniibacillus kamchatkensis]|uniref:PAS domain S-box-containing protein/diguanylate cyclase (GGDEF) domain-containing protein n=1 Tax=Gordoniibacillus kamchatkensis TaxID=1590651 RepID=A0ABR5ACQ6_9BACL|nr:GGDEF domain-containing protein [Paenibacillus sp. VKM B-2647]KIL38809.1 hypothetical protein SD70_24330 [Paenibacillus sp. VKM B-2647]